MQEANFNTVIFFIFNRRLSPKFNNSGQKKDESCTRQRTIYPNNVCKRIGINSAKALRNIENSLFPSSNNTKLFSRIKRIFGKKDLLEDSPKSAKLINKKKIKEDFIPYNSSRNATITTNSKLHVKNKIREPKAEMNEKCFSNDLHNDLVHTYMLPNALTVYRKEPKKYLPHYPVITLNRITGNELKGFQGERISIKELYKINEKLEIGRAHV